MNAKQVFKMVVGVILIALAVFCMDFAVVNIRNLPAGAWVSVIGALVALVIFGGGALMLKSSFETN